MLDDTTCDRLLQRIGLTGRPAADAAGLRVVHRAFVSHVPYEDLAVQLGEFEPLDPLALVKRTLHGGRGGYCFEANTVLQTLLVALGFAVERRQGIVGARDSHATGVPTNHLALVVRTPDAGPFIAESGWGEGPLDPLPLIEGPVYAGVFNFRIERQSDGWWVTQHKYGSSAGFWFADAPATLAEFQPHHERLSTSPDSSFVQTSSCNSRSTTASSPSAHAHYSPTAPAVATAGCSRILRRSPPSYATLSGSTLRHSAPHACTGSGPRQQINIKPIGRPRRTTYRPAPDHPPDTSGYVRPRRDRFDLGRSGRRAIALATSGSPDGCWRRTTAPQLLKSPGRRNLL